MNGLAEYACHVIRHVFRPSFLEYKKNALRRGFDVVFFIDLILQFITAYFHEAGPAWGWDYAIRDTRVDLNPRALESTRLR